MTRISLLGPGDEASFADVANEAARRLYGALGGVESDAAPAMVSFRLSSESDEGKQP
jgi:hypothetical protein